MKFPDYMTPIWLNNDGNKDEYGDFFPDVAFKDGENYTLRIVCDTDRAVYLDGKLVSFGQYADYPDTPVYEDIPLPAKSGSVLKITAWHSGIDSQTHVATKAYVAFCIYENGKPIYSSSEETLCRPTPEYVAHLCKIITSQMGAGFAMTSRAEAEDLKNAVEIEVDIHSLRPRPIKPLYLADAGEGKVTESGFFRFNGGADSASLMANAEIVYSVDCADGKYILFDLGKETVGFPEIYFECDENCDVYVGWGEHITDGKCRAAIHIRRFTTELYARSGENRFFPVLRRFGLRYMQIYFTSTKVKNVSLKFHPTLLPAEIKSQIFAGEKAELREKIRDTAIHTLQCCMHEHYEDCPWREQALYTLDSRNQMLAGYEVFKDKNAEFVRANLDLISRGVRKDGILALCYPAGLDYPIPFYTLAYLMQMDEYIANTGDVTLAQEKFDILVSLLDVFYSRSGDNGLAKRFPDSEGYWNFYEWSKHLSGSPKSKELGINDQPYEANLSSALSLASNAMANICIALGKANEAEFYSGKAEMIARSIGEIFYRQDIGLFFDFTDRPDIQPSALTQAMCLLCGAAEGLNQNKILNAIAQNGNELVVPATLSMACFRYDALLKADRVKYSDVILDEIDRDCGYMLDCGATTFWETLKGEADFSGAGSLCHGWSAMAAYYYSKLL